MTIALPTLEAAAETRKFIKEAGGDATWDRLAEYLEKEASGKDIFVINRSFDAPVDLVFEMLTNPDHLSQCLPPKGFEMEFIEADIRPGGKTFYVMTASKGFRMYGGAEYLRIEKPHRIVYRQQFRDEKGNVARHPGAPTWPETMLTTVRLAEEAPRRTRVTVTWEIDGAATPEEIETFVKSRAGMTQGWTGSFDRMEAYLANLGGK
jgi:uncharacterized protein YndB with AHSA1/START domain